MLRPPHLAQAAVWTGRSLSPLKACDYAPTSFHFRSRPSSVGRIAQLALGLVNLPPDCRVDALDLVDQSVPMLISLNQVIRYFNVLQQSGGGQSFFFFPSRELEHLCLWLNKARRQRGRALSTPCVPCLTQFHRICTHGRAVSTNGSHRNG